MKTDMVCVQEHNKILHVKSGFVEIAINLNDGTADYMWDDGAFIKEAYSAFKYQNTMLSSKAYMEHAADPDGAAAILDEFGSGLQFTVLHKSADLPDLKQIYTIYEELPYFFIRVEVTGDTELETNYMAPIVTESSSKSTFEIGALEGAEIRALLIPFDNDKWVRYSSVKMPDQLESFEVTALYEPNTRKALIVGSVTHDSWKTGINVHGNSGLGISRLEAYGGAAGEFTRDTIPHGPMKGTTLLSPLLFVGSFADYREGLEVYGEANAKIVPAMKWEGVVPFGWNSWSAAGDKLDYDLYVHTSDFLKELQEQGFHNNETVYINFDSFWSNLSEEQFEAAVRHVWQNGQKAGIYWTPFTFWGNNYDQPVEGTDGQYTYRDLLLRDWQGNVLPKLDGGLAIDPTHPGNLMRTDYHIERFVQWGFEYIKLDFLGHGSLEGEHYNNSIHTGIQAYNFGMDMIKRKLDPERIGRRFFINLSIAPLFPHQYAHSRRISCDAFGKLKDTEYMLNSLTNGWWINSKLYRYNDPDHTVLYKSYNQRSTKLHEGRSRLTASIISGTVLLLGDDFRREKARDRALDWLHNQEILNLARKGVTFVPVEGKADSSATDMFMLKEEAENGSIHVYLALFNFKPYRQSIKQVDLERIGLNKNHSYLVKDLWESETFTIRGNFEIKLKPAESKIIRLLLPTDQKEHE